MCLDVRRLRPTHVGSTEAYEHHFIHTTEVIHEIQGYSKHGAGLSFLNAVGEAGWAAVSNYTAADAMKSYRPEWKPSFNRLYTSMINRHLHFFRFFMKMDEL